VVQERERALYDIRREARTYGFLWDDDRLLVYIWTDPKRTRDVAETLRRKGVRVRYVGRWGIEAVLSPYRLRMLNRITGIYWVDAPQMMRPLAVVSEGLEVVGAPAWQRLHQAAGGGTPLRVGIVDIGFRGYEGLLGSELPPSDRVFTRNFREDGDFGTTVHGTAVAEIMYDFLGGENVEFYLAAIDTSSAVAQAVAWFMEKGVIAYNGSIGSSLRAGDGQCCRDDYEKHRQARMQGILPIFAAGNEGDEHWITDDFYDPDGDRWLNFSGGDESNCFIAPGGYAVDVILEWYDWPASARDYDLYITDVRGFIVARSTKPQNGRQPPYEFVSITPPRTTVLCAWIHRYSGPAGVPIEMFISPSLDMEYLIPAYSIAAPADSPYVIAVGAVNWDTDRLASYSSRGPTIDGRLKPDISAPTRVSTVSYGREEFPGTSSAAPHVTGAIALMIQKAFRLFPATEVFPILAPRSVDLGVRGPDIAYGVGRLYMLP